MHSSHEIAVACEAATESRVCSRTPHVLGMHVLCQVTQQACASGASKSGKSGVIIQEAVSAIRVACHMYCKTLQTINDWDVSSQHCLANQSNHSSA